MTESSSRDFDGGNGQSPPSSISHHHDHLNGATAVIKDDLDDSILMSLKTRNLHEYLRRDTSNSGSQKDPPLHQHSVEKSEEPLVKPLNKKGAAFNKANKLEQSHGHPPLDLITAKELNSSIIASETTRAFCSVLIALLAILSYTDYPLVGINFGNSKSILALKPLYMVLLTDVSVVFAHLVLKKRGSIEVLEEEDDNRGKVPGEDGLNWARAVRVLERGLVLHQTIRALFIDCSVYVVIVACGLALI